MPCNADLFVEGSTFPGQTTAGACHFRSGPSLERSLQSLSLLLSNASCALRQNSLTTVLFTIWYMAWKGHMCGKAHLHALAVNLEHCQQGRCLPVQVAAVHFHELLSADVSLRVCGQG